MRGKNVQKKCLTCSDKMITVFTPTYNRSHLLPRLYRSLREQTCKNFEWLIVDDGSTDNTKDVVASWMKDNIEFSIRYYQKKNGGKHTAINFGVNLAKGDLFFIVDSDDYLPETSVAIVVKVWNGLIFDKSIDCLDEFAGICGLDGYKDGHIVGSGLPTDIIDTTYIDIRNRYMISGDMKEIYSTRILKDFPFPEIVGEYFCPEALLWNRIAQKYKLRYFNKVIYIAAYQDSGLTANITRIRMASPIATMMTYSEWFAYNIPVVKKIKMAINYWRFAFCTSNRDVKIASWGNLFAPLGWLMHLNDKRKVK